MNGFKEYLKGKTGTACVVFTIKSCFLSLPSVAQEESSAARLNNNMECTFIFIFCLLGLRQK